MMFTRVTMRSLNESVLQSMYSNRSTLNELQQQVATGKRVDTPSDDASAAIDILTSNTQLNKIEVYNKNIDYSISEAEMTDQVLTNVTEVVQRAKELTVQASTGTLDSDELQNINSEIEQLIETLKDAANTKFGNKYLFSGVKTETVPFEDTDLGEITYNGTPETEEYKRTFEIGKNTTVDINFAGDSIFGDYIQTAAGPPAEYAGTGLFGTLKTLSAELQADPPSHDNIREKIDDLESSLDTVLNARAKLGGVINRLEMTQNKYEVDTINYTKFKSAAEDIDLAQAISDMSFQETVLQASLQVSAKLIGPSLMNYM